MKYSEIKAAKGAETPEQRERIDALKDEMRLAEEKAGNYRQHRRDEFGHALRAFQDSGDSSRLLALVGSLVGDVESARKSAEHERANRKDVARRKRATQEKLSRGLTENACAALYMVAGRVLLAPEIYTEGQRQRLETLILDVLSESYQYGGRLIHDLAESAVKP